MVGDGLEGGFLDETDVIGKPIRWHKHNLTPILISLLLSHALPHIPHNLPQPDHNSLQASITLLTLA